ncbi:hypothetical protein FRC07_003797 [Ceratobasidium sp. 392]|nr:hypothetical protein FRC07_003797 [Ceratobasidium sp. 392]
MDRRVEVGAPKEIEAWTAFDFSGRGSKYSSLKWSYQHFTGVEWDNRTRTKAIYKIVEPGHQGWSPYVDQELGNYDFLLGADIDFRHPDVRSDMMSWGQWVLKETGATGFRLDACKHIDRMFLREWLTNARKSYGNRLFAVGEVWNEDVPTILRYMRAFPGEMCYFDVPLHANLFRASKLGPAFDLRTILRGSIIGFVGEALRFDKSLPKKATDMSMFGVQVEDRMKLIAYALILLRPGGHPCVYHGDIFPSPESPIGCDLPKKIETLCTARKLYAYGALKDYFVEKNLIGFVRLGDEKHPGGCAVVMCNLPESERPKDVGINMNVGPANQGSWKNLLDSSAVSVSVGSNGYGRFTCSGQVSVWVKSS